MGSKHPRLEDRAYMAMEQTLLRRGESDTPEEIIWELVRWLDKGGFAIVRKGGV